MKTFKINQESEFKIYGEILHGRLQPHKSEFSDEKQLLNLIEYANTKEFSIDISDDKHYETMHYSIYAYLGYKDPDDLMINIHPGRKNGTSVITVIPNKYYLLGDMMEDDIEKPPCFKSRCYLRLIMDEFERIKIRACNLLNTIDKSDQLRILVLKNLRIAEFLLRESSAYSHFFVIPDKHSKMTSMYYIIDCLKKFLIKSIRFYHSFFDPYITDFFEQSEKLIKNVDRATCSSCTKYLFPEDSDNTLGDSNSISAQYRNDALNCKEDFLRMGYGNSDLLSNATNNKVSKPQPIRWMGKINLLVSLFYDLMEKGIIYIHETDENPGDHFSVSKEKIQSGTNMNLVEFLYINFLDSKGNRLSKDTLRTYLNPNRLDKRSKRSQGLNLDKYR